MAGGDPTRRLALQAIAGRAHGGPARRVRFVQIGAMTSPTITLPGAALRSSGLELLGSGLGSVSNERLVHTIGLLLKAIRPATMTIDADAVPLTDVESAWNGPASKRIVFTS